MSQADQLRTVVEDLEQVRGVFELSEATATTKLALNILKSCNKRIQAISNDLDKASIATNLADNSMEMVQGFLANSGQFFKGLNPPGTK